MGTTGPVGLPKPGWIALAAQQLVNGELQSVECSLNRCTAVAIAVPQGGASLAVRGAGHAGAPMVGRAYTCEGTAPGCSHAASTWQQHDANVSAVQDCFGAAVPCCSVRAAAAHARVRGSAIVADRRNYSAADHVNAGQRRHRPSAAHRAHSTQGGAEVAAPRSSARSMQVRSTVHGRCTAMPFDALRAQVRTLQRTRMSAHSKASAQATSLCRCVYALKHATHPAYNFAPQPSCI
jgi:hypothetical protein